MVKRGEILPKNFLVLLSFVSLLRVTNTKKKFVVFHLSPNVIVCSSIFLNDSCSRIISVELSWACDLGIRYRSGSLDVRHLPCLNADRVYFFSAHFANAVGIERS